MMALRGIAKHQVEIPDLSPLKGFGGRNGSEESSEDNNHDPVLVCDHKTEGGL